MLQIGRWSDRRVYNRDWKGGREEAAGTEEREVPQWVFLAENNLSRLYKQKINERNVFNISNRKPVMCAMETYIICANKIILLCDGLSDKQFS